MKKLIMVLPLAILLAYCSGPNNTQTTTNDETIDATTTASTTEATTTDVATTTTDEINTTGVTTTTDESTNTTTVSSINTPVADVNVTMQHDESNPFDVNDPMYQHFVRTNGQYWSYNYNTPVGAPLAGTYDASLNGDWALQMTPELTTAWRVDNSFDLWRSSVGLSATATSDDVSSTNPQVAMGDTYISASESFDTREATDSSSVSADATVTTNVADVSTINYRAANGNMYLMPRFNLYLDNGSFTGYTGCNNISGRVHVSGTTLHFQNTQPSTAIACMGGFNEQAFLDMLKRVDSYTYVNNELQLMQGNQVVMKFKRNATDVSMK